VSSYPLEPLPSPRPSRANQSISLPVMDQVFPSPVDNVDAATFVAGERRAPTNHRPWVMMNMISSIDGAIELDGLSGGLGGPGDKAMFSAYRAVADIIVAASGTVIAENYRRPQTDESLQTLREARGQQRIPRIAIVSNSLSISVDHRVFAPDARPFVVTNESADRDRRQALEQVADVLTAGPDHVDLHEMLNQFRDHGASVVLVEGGPTLNAAFVAEDLVDEFCLTVSPLLVGGSGPRVVGASGTSMARPMVLERTLHDEGFLFHRYLRDRTSPLPPQG